MQPTIGLNAGFLMEELEKGLKELKGMSNSVNSQNPRASEDRTTNQRIQMEGSRAQATYVAEDSLAGWTSVGEAALGPEGVQCPSIGEC